jgi:hypothetical protein
LNQAHLDSENFTFLSAHGGLADDGCMYNTLSGGGGGVLFLPSDEEFSKKSLARRDGSSFRSEWREKNAARAPQNYNWMQTSLLPRLRLEMHFFG